MRVDIISIFPEYFAPLDLSLIGKARGAGLLELTVHDLRSWTSDVHRTVDDSPYGGGPGMVMRPEPWSAALSSLPRGTLVVPSPVAIVYRDLEKRQRHPKYSFHLESLEPRPLVNGKVDPQSYAVKIRVESAQRKR